VGDACTEDIQCSTANCVGGQCEAGVVVGGEDCVTDAECASGTCASGACTAVGANDGGGGGGDGGTNGGGNGGDGGSTNGGGNGGDGGSTNGGGNGDGGSGTSEDAGDPLEQELPDFCAGSGTVVNVGAGSTCAGDLAEETFRYAICTCENFDVESQLTVYSFDSTEGGPTSNPGDPQWRQDGHVGVNVGPWQSYDQGGDPTTLNKIEINGNVFIGPNVDMGGDPDPGTGGLRPGSSSLVSGTLYTDGPGYAGSNSDLTVGGDVFVNGPITNDYDVGGDCYTPDCAAADNTFSGGGQCIETPIPTVLPCPCEDADILDIAGIIAWAADPANNDNENLVGDGGVLTLADLDNATTGADGGQTTGGVQCGRYYIGSVTPGENLNLHVAGRVVLFIDDDLDVGGVNITVEEGAELDIFVTGLLTVGSSASFGSQDQPSSVRSYLAGTGDIVLSGSAGFAGNIYAPRADVQTGGSVNIYGAIFANTINFQSNTTIFFDSAIRSAGDVCDVPEPGVDGGVPVGADGGTPVGADGGVVPPADAGPPPDAGFDDAGNPIPLPDAGPPPDSGPAPDAGPPPDSGPAPDAGPPPDSGPAPDAGPVDECTDKCSFDCPNSQACFEDPGGNTCGACATSLDCCPPFTCAGGQCVISG
jgi:hypothetical protein